MKRLLTLIPALIVLVGCEVYIVEPVYDIRNEFVGTYYVEEYSKTTYTTTYFDFDVVKLGYSSDEVLIRNFYGVEIDVVAIVETGTRLRIPFQLIDGYEVSGTATLQGRKLVMNYSVRDLYAYPRFTDYCSTYAWK
jgi:hypothetical protein